MHIKTITIQGFKSYRDQTQIEPFSPGHNVVVGRNGSGKSNFFAAIRFVLSDAYTSMSREERQSLLHEGVSVTTTLSAFVEIIFDNSDNRFPTGRDEVVLRRTIGLKKDEYSLDKKSASKADVMNLLESAGFSKSNPYYIVPQGRITALTNAKDHERLALLKEVAGTKVYEQRRAESLRIMAETSAKRSKISELLDYIESRLAELEEEKEELKEFQQKDKERRCLEYALYQRELEEVTEALDDVEEERKNDVHGANVRREQFHEREKEIQVLERTASECKHELSTLSLTLHGANAEMTDLVRSRTELQCVIDDLHASAERSGTKREQMETELAEVQIRIDDKEQALATLLPQWQASRNQELEEKRGLDEVTARLDALYSKQGRLNRFRTSAERDSYLNKEIAAVRSYATQQEEVAESTRHQLDAAKRGLIELEVWAVDIQARLENSRTRAGELSQQISAMKEEHTSLTEKRKDLWREEAKYESLVARASDELKGAQRTLASMMDKDTGSGLHAVDRIADRVEGVYGPLYRLFEVSDSKYATAIEQTAGNSLFHVVVDTDETASRVLDIMMKEKIGRVTFMPLNRLKPKNPAFPSAPDAIPLIEKMRYDAVHAKAFQQVFGKTCVCRDLATAAAYVRSHGLNTITLDGDKVDRKGALTGGYHDVRRSRMEAIKNVGTWKAKLASDQKHSKDVKDAIRNVDQEITKIYGKIQIASSQQNQAMMLRDPLLREIGTATQEQDRVKDRILKLEQDIDGLDTELAGLKAKVEGYENELKTPLAAGLTRAEESTLTNLTQEQEERKKRMMDLTKGKNELGTQKNALEIELKESLRRRREELRAKVDVLDVSRSGDTFSKEDLESRLRELASLNSTIDNLSRKTQQMEKDTERRNSQLQDTRANLDKLQARQTEDSRGIERQEKGTERYLAKRQLLQGRKEECNRNIRDLGVLPEEAFQKYTNEKMDKLLSKLHKVNDGLKKFAHVNKKAFEQYNNFTKQRDQLLDRRKELDKSAKAIEELVEVLDQRKDEAIERTFKQVASNFEEVFESLVPAGRGRLIIQRRIDQDQGDIEDVAETQQSSVDSYTGVSIKVSFNSKVDEGLRIQQLSGGQKSLVALATVFAIQKCDPAPFYLFDEIDANLDSQYRTAVAAMIHELSTSAQFITTTFRPEMLVNADKYYGVLFNNQKVSSIRSIKKEEAMEFVDQEAQAH